MNKYMNTHINYIYILHLYFYLLIKIYPQAGPRSGTMFVTPLQEALFQAVDFRRWSTHREQVESS